jgi:hypothetical protein
MTDTEILDRMLADAVAEGDAELVAEMMALDDSEGRVIYG